MTEIELGQFYPVKTNDLPESWAVSYVGDFALAVQSGFACGKHGREDGVPHLRPMNVSRNGALDLSDVKTVPPEFNEKRLKRGDVLFNNTNSPELVGKTAFVTERGSELAFSNHMTQVKVAEGVSAEFLAVQFHYLWAQKYFFHRCVKHVNQASISATELATRIPFVCPPTNEQRRIVERIEAMFDEIDHGVENLKKARATLGLYRQSLLKSAFEGRLTADWRARNADKLPPPETLLARLEAERDTWHEAEFQRWQDDVAQWEDRGGKDPKRRKPEAYKSGDALTEEELSVLPDLPPEWLFVRLNDIAYIGSGMSVSKSRKHEDPVEIPYLRVANVQRGFLELDEIKTMLIERSQLAGLQLREWDILFNEGGDRDKLGRGWIWEMQVDPCITQNHVFRGTPFRTDKDWSIYISQWGNSYGRDYFETGGKQTTNLASINKTVLKALPVPICAPEEQAEITRILDERLSAADALEAEIDAGMTRAEALRQSILKQAFSGKLVPQDPKDEPAATLLARIKAEKATKPKATRKRKAMA
ncbi:restriction endonuclease subunit S [Tropicimonas sp. IMCC34011]|uniref:restriction endonuclease subunit S n=1 Tax=Tropicimonas sp. IMCC34011 TaxID=2248759 RepID=UPI000E279EEE|nr:restriction endonuclease subunit S [Tropicimonas sp. IMCC34011]